MLYIVIFQDGRTKAYTDKSTADHCAACDGGTVVTVAIVAG
jgi:hypothetical protein